MASLKKILENLESIEVSAYKNVIDKAIENGKEKYGYFIILNQYLANRSERLRAISKAYYDKVKGDEIEADYAVFKSILENVGGRNKDLDMSNGWISKTLYGDIQKQYLRKRDIASLDMYQSGLISSIIGRLDTFESSLEEIKSNLP